MTYSLNDEKMFMDISDSIAIVINSESGIYYVFNSFGTIVFDAISHGMATEDISEALEKLPQAPQDMKKRLSDFVEELKSLELIVVGKQGDSFSFDAETAKNDNFVLEVKACDDAQEMLLADPIHEVKEETGWTPEKESIGYSKEETKEREKKIQN